MLVRKRSADSTGSGQGSQLHTAAIWLDPPYPALFGPFACSMLGAMIAGHHGIARCQHLKAFQVVPVAG